MKKQLFILSASLLAASSWAQQASLFIEEGMVKSSDGGTLTPTSLIDGNALSVFYSYTASDIATLESTFSGFTTIEDYKTAFNSITDWKALPLSALAGYDWQSPFEATTARPVIAFMNATSPDNLVVGSEVGLLAGTTVPVTNVDFFAYGFNFAGNTYDVILGDTGSIQLVTAVPEPSVYAALLGLGALGFVMWRRRRN